MAWEKSGIRKVHIDGVTWCYVVESSHDRRNEIRIYEPGTKQIMVRVPLEDFPTVKPSNVKKYIEENLI